MDAQSNAEREAPAPARGVERVGGLRRGRAGRRIAVSVAVALSAGAVTAVVPSSGAATLLHHRVKHVSSGGSLTMLENVGYVGNWTAGLNPITAPNDTAQATMMNAIFGQLFQLGPHGSIIDDLATGYQMSPNSRRLTITLRHGVSFTDGTPFDAAAVAYNWRQDIANKGASGSPDWPDATVSTSGKYVVVLTLGAPDSAAFNAIQDSNANWIISPTAVRRLGKVNAGIRPVGAGPFEVVSDTPSVKLALKRNPHYWQAGHPYLSKLTFLDVSGDEAALQDMKAGDGQAYEYMGTPNLVPGFKSSGFRVTADVNGTPLSLAFNTLTSPFNNVKAREAVSYATDVTALDRLLYGGKSPVVQSFTAPSDLFYEAKVPGYRTYDLAKARALVKQLGGLSFNIFYLETGTSLQILEALQAMYQDAGMKVTISNDPTPTGLAFWGSGKWQAEMGTIGDWDPAKELQLHLGFGEPFSGVKDAQLQRLLNAAITVSTPSARTAAYHRVAQYLSQKDYYEFFFPSITYDIAASGVTGPGLTSALPGFQGGPQILWQDVRAAK